MRLAKDVGRAAWAAGAAVAALDAAAEARDKQRKLLQELLAKHDKGKTASSGPWRCAQPEATYGPDV
jgi:hypothetical protein